nr:MAG TPA: hypothetical protein [Caudoviricetes sp.]
MITIQISFLHDSVQLFPHFHTSKHYMLLNKYI